MGDRPPQVVGQDMQGELAPYRREAAAAEAGLTLTVLEHAEDRLDHGLALAVAAPSLGVGHGRAQRLFGRIPAVAFDLVSARPARALGAVGAGGGDVADVNGRGGACRDSDPWL